MHTPTQDQQAALEKLVNQKRKLAKLRMIIYVVSIAAIAAVSYIIGKNQVRLEDTIAAKTDTIATNIVIIKKKDSTIEEKKQIIAADSIIETSGYKKDSVKRLNTRITIKYFTTSKEGDYITKLLENSGFKWEAVEGKNESTNAIWKGDDVPDKVFEQVVLLLLKGGAKLQQIAKIQNPTDKNRRQIQIGHSTKAESIPPFTVDEFLKRKGTLAY